MKKRIAVALLSLLAVMQFSASAQEVAVKTNLIYDATLTINAGVEARLAPKWTFDLSGNFNGWKVKIEFEAKDSGGKPYRSEYWFILDKEALCVVKSFEVPLM